MLFNSETFLFFAVVFFSIFFLLGHRAQIYFVLVASAVFYGWWDWRFLGLIAVVVVVNFYLGACIHAAGDDERRRWRWLMASVVFSLAVLGYFKYTNFFIDSFTRLVTAVGLQASPFTLQIILPIGISFFTFHLLSYTIDIYRRKLRPEPDLVAFATYVALFPHMVAGPIIRASRLLPQLRTRRRFRWPNLFVGLEQIVVGLFLKVVIADNLGPTVDRVFATPDAFNSLYLLVGVLFFAFQIYGDFAGYSLMAIGLGRIMGYDFGVNFRRPYMARDFSDFWRRWHVSLSSWLRDYLYVSLGGNRHGRAATYRNLMATMVLGGLWHGAAWTFIVWGTLHGLYLVLQRLLTPAWLAVAGFLRLPAWLRATLAIVTVFALTNVAWVFFRAASFGDAFTILQRILLLGDFRVAGIDLLFQVVLGSALISGLVAVEVARQSPGFRLFWRTQRVVRTTGIVALLLVIPLFGSFSGERFIYFQF